MEAVGEGQARFMTQPAPHRVYPALLAADELAALLDWALADFGRYEPSQVRAGLRPEVRRSLSLRDLGPARPLLDARLGALTPQLFADLGVAPFDVAKIEYELISHGDGDRFHRHVDTMSRAEATADRAISAVYYFHREPKGFSGGALRLYGFGGDDGPFVDVEPAQNSLLAFPAWAPHEVLPVSCPSGDRADSRLSINCWFYRRRKG